MRSIRALAGLLIFLLAPSLSAQAPQWRADVRQTGDQPFVGTMYYGGQRVRIEGTADGQEAVVIIDGAAGTMQMLMPDQRMYVTVDVGSAPFATPGTETMDADNPCSNDDLTDCRSLGTETVNGRTARGWEYTMDGERYTSWISTELDFPVRTIDSDGGTSDFTNITLGPQPASLFELPAGYTAMDMGGFGRGFPGGGRGGRGGQPAGRGRGTARGQVPPADAQAGAATAIAGLDPAALAGLGLDPATIAQIQAAGADPSAIAAQMTAMGTATNSAPWEAGDGWVIELVVNAQGQESGGPAGPMNATYTETYSAELRASVPVTYGTPAVGAAMGPAWQLVPTLGSPRALQEPLTFIGTTRYHYEGNSPAQCPINDGVRQVIDAQGTADFRTTDHSSFQIMGAQVRWEIAGDLRTHSLMVAIGPGDATSEAWTTRNITTSPCPGSQGGTTEERRTTQPRLGINLSLQGLPLASAPGPMRGTATVPMRFQIGGFDDELEATVQWTLRPM